MSAQEAISMIKDGDKIGVGGFIGMGHPQELSVAIEKSFLETGHPRDLTVMFSAGVGDGTPDLGLNHMGHEGLLKRIIGGHWGLIPINPPTPILSPSLIMLMASWADITFDI